MGALRRACAHGLRAYGDLSSDKLGAKIRNARLLCVPYVVVVGDKEVENRTVSPRSRDLDKNLDAMPLMSFVEKLKAEAVEPSLQGHPPPLLAPLDAAAVGTMES